MLSRAPVIDPRRHWTLATAALALFWPALTLSIAGAVRVGANVYGANRGVASPLVAWVVMRWKMAAL